MAEKEEPRGKPHPEPGTAGSPKPRARRPRPRPAEDGGGKLPVVGSLSAKVPEPEGGHRPSPELVVDGGSPGLPALGVLTLDLARALGHRTPPVPPKGGAGPLPTIGLLSVVGWPAKETDVHRRLAAERMAHKPRKVR